MDIPQKDVDWALEVERSVQEGNRELYLECLNGKAMSERKTSQEIRDGCILSGIYARIVKASAG